jgi:ribosomal protein S18 acetylase RimI-like enzyme
VADAAAAGWAPLPPALDEAAAALLAECPALGSDERARAAIAAVRGEDQGDVYGWVEDGKLVAVYGLVKRGLSFDLLWLAVAPDRRGQRYGRSALVDALRRCGRSPMTATADDAAVGWYQRVGFKTVGRKSLPEGGFRYRLGWYAPRRPDEPGYGAH